jgi:DNA-binding HxlR family transcriptional regulator
VNGRTYGLYDPLAQALDDAGERWALLVIRELLDGPRRYGELQQRLPGLSTARLADRLRELRTAGLLTDGYTLTEQGRGLAPAIHALTRFGLTRLRPLAGTATVYRPSFAAWALRARADAAAPVTGSYVCVTHIESESFRTRHDQDGAATWGDGPDPGPAEVVSTDTITAMALATGTWTLAQARRSGCLIVQQTADHGRRWVAAHGLGEGERNHRPF